jgi:hypothetical protein
MGFIVSLENSTQQVSSANLDTGQSVLRTTRQTLPLVPELDFEGLIRGLRCNRGFTIVINFVFNTADKAGF